VDDERFATPDLRYRNAEALRDLCTEVFATRTRDEWVAALRAHDVPAGPVLDYDEVERDPQAVANGFFVTVDHPVFGTLTEAGWGMSLSETPPSVRRPAPDLGEHTREVLHELGYDEEAITEIVAAGFGPRGHNPLGY
jgi:formyl-CoA transferase